MALLVVGYPQLTETAYTWVQRIRQQHDPQYSLVAPHFTLVFPVTTVPQNDLIAHVTARSKHTAAFPFTIRCVIVVKDLFSPLTHLFLVPDEGFAEIVKLHDAFYTDVLADALRLDIPFTPHITIGANEDAQVCKALADDINHQDIRVQGQIGALDIVLYENKTVTSVKRITLA